MTELEIIINGEKIKAIPDEVRLSSQKLSTFLLGCPERESFDHCKALDMPFVFSFILKNSNIKKFHVHNIKEIIEDELTIIFEGLERK